MGGLLHIGVYLDRYVDKISGQRLCRGLNLAHHHTTHTGGDMQDTVRAATRGSVPDEADLAKFVLTRIDNERQIARDREKAAEVDLAITRRMASNVEAALEVVTASGAKAVLRSLLSGFQADIAAKERAFESATNVRIAADARMELAAEVYETLGGGA